MKQMACQEWVNRDAEVVATCQHLSYFPLVVESAQGHDTHHEENHLDDSVLD